MDKTIQRKFNQACVQYGLLSDGDRILVGLSGGKDSLLLTRLLALRSRIFKPRFTVEAVHVVMDNVAYDMDTAWMQTFCRELGIPLHVLHTSFEVRPDSGKTPCFLCSWNRRKTLFRFAEEHGFNKVALGHHQDDILTTWLLGIAFEGNAQPSMRPLLPLEHYPLAIIRPLCLVPEPLIAEYAAGQDLVHTRRPCPYEKDTQRQRMHDILILLEAQGEEVRHSMWNACRRMMAEQERLQPTSPEDSTR